MGSSSSDSGHAGTQLRFSLSQGCFDSTKYRELRSYVVRLVHCQLAQRRLPDELVADTCSEVWRSLPRFRGQCSQASWIYAIVIRQVRLWLRSRRRRDRLAEAISYHFEIEERASPEADLHWQHVAHLMRASLKELSERERACLVMMDVEELPARVVADRLHSTPEAVRKAASRARARLRAWMLE